MPPAYLKWACLQCTVDTSSLSIVPTSPIQSTKVQASTSVLPPADYLVVTWTEGETDGTAQVLGAGEYFCHQLSPTGNNLIPLIIDTSILPLPNSTELESTAVQCHALYFTTVLSGKSVICLKTNFHPKFEPESGSIGVPMQNFFKWLIENNNFKYIISTGTSGGIWPNMDVGDVVVCNSAMYDPNDQKLIDTGKAGKSFTSSVTDVAGTLTGGKTQYDLIAGNLNSYASCALGKISPVRQTANGAMPHLFYGPLSPGVPDTVISDIVFTDEKNNVDNKNYKSLGAAFDNNDAFVAEACNEVNYNTWVSIRNISDLPGAASDETYNTLQDCTSIIGALAIYAFITGH